MKKTTIILLCLLTPLFLQANDTTLHQDTSLSWVDAQVKAIQVPRTGVPQAYINALHDPFIYTYTVKKDHKLVHVSYKHHYIRIRPLRLMMIINHQAMINYRWYSLNDKVRDYKIVSINPAGVTLRNRYKVIRLSLRKHYNNVKIHIK